MFKLEFENQLRNFDIQKSGVLHDEEISKILLSNFADILVNQCMANR